MSGDVGAPTAANALDAAALGAAGALGRSGLEAPDVLLFPATGASGLIGALDGHAEVELGSVPDVPPSWQDVPLHAGCIGETRVWVIEDAQWTGPATDGDAPAWTCAFPVWLAAAAGTRIVVHTSAGTSLARGGARPAEVGALLRLTDHINLSGSTPLMGLGESRLGPLFPDQTRVHDRVLARIADEAARESDLALTPAIAACTIGPALATCAELSWCAGAGADIAVQRLAGPLVAAAHAGIATLALTAVADVAGEPVGLAELVDRATRTAPTLDGLVLRIAQRLGPHARSLAAGAEA